VRKLPQELRRSLAWDRGKEMADHKSFTIATNLANTSPIIVYQSRAK
jgi:IS30 family transposase